MSSRWSAAACRVCSALALASIATFASACKRASKPEAANSNEPEFPAPPPSAPAGPPPKCTRAGGEIAVFEATDAQADAEAPPNGFGAIVGGAAGDERGFWVGLRETALRDPVVVKVPMQPGEGVARAEIAASYPREVIGAPSIALAKDKGVLVAASRRTGESARSFSVWSLGDGAAAAPKWSVPQGDDEVDATAMLVGDAGPVVAWGEAFGDPPSGRIRLVRIESAAAAAATPSTSASAKPLAPPPALAASAKAGTQAARPAPADAVSPESSDASWPTLLASPDGKHAALIWLAERPETISERPSDKDSPALGEPSQAEAYRWVEAVIVDLASGRPIGEAMALTAREGHAQTFTARWATSGLVLAVRDDPRPADGDGGTLSIVRAKVTEGTTRAIAPATSAAIVTRDVAPGEAWLLGASEPARMVYLAADGEAYSVNVAGAPDKTNEPALSHGRILANAGGSMLVSRLVGRGVRLSVVRCGG